MHALILSKHNCMLLPYFRMDACINACMRLFLTFVCLAIISHHTLAALRCKLSQRASEELESRALQTYVWCFIFKLQVTAMQSIAGRAKLWKKKREQLAACSWLHFRAWIESSALNNWQQQFSALTIVRQFISHLHTSNKWRAVLSILLCKHVSHK